MGQLFNKAKFMYIFLFYKSKLDKQKITIKLLFTEGIGNVTASAEFNFCADPEAASIVLQLTSCPTYIAGWELCFKYTKLTRQWRDQVDPGSRDIR